MWTKQATIQYSISSEILKISTPISFDKNGIWFIGQISKFNILNILLKISHHCSVNGLVRQSYTITWTIVGELKINSTRTNTHTIYIYIYIYIHIHIHIYIYIIKHRYWHTYTHMNYILIKKHNGMDSANGGWHVTSSHIGWAHTPEWSPLIQYDLHMCIETEILSFWHLLVLSAPEVAKRNNFRCSKCRKCVSASAERVETTSMEYDSAKYLV